MTKFNFIFSMIFLITANSLLSQDSIPNQDFEVWNSSTSPKFWQSTNIFLPPEYITCSQTSNSYNGIYAVQLKTIDMDGNLIPGVLTIGNIEIGYTSGGIGFSGKPESLKGYFRHPSAGDLVMVVVQFYKNGNEIGSGFWSTTDSIPGFIEFIAPITFQSTENPDTVNITILTDQYILGSSITLDALHFEYTTTSIINSPKEHMSIYPNPCNKYVVLDLPRDESFEICIFDLSGKMVLEKTWPKQNRIDTSELPPGTYILLVKTSMAIYREKLIKK